MVLGNAPHALNYVMIYIFQSVVVMARLMETGARWRERVQTFQVKGSVHPTPVRAITTVDLMNTVISCWGVTVLGIVLIDQFLVLFLLTQSVGAMANPTQISVSWLRVEQVLPVKGSV